MNERIQATLTAIEFIESHLREDITVADVAAAAGYSLYHFIRTFNQTVQHTPYGYLMRRRLSEAASELLKDEGRVIDTALDFRFNSHETFTRAFRRIFGMPPTRWRDQGSNDLSLLMPALNRDFLEYLTAPDFGPPRMIEMEKIVLAGLMAPLTVDPEGISSLWRNLREALGGLSLGPEPHDFWGVRIQPQMPKGTTFYLAAIKIPSLEAAPSKLVTKIIPAGDYASLIQPSRVPLSDFGRTVLYHTFLPKAGLILSQTFEIEHFGERREILFPVRESKKGNLSHPKN